MAVPDEKPRAPAARRSRDRAAMEQVWIAAWASAWFSRFFQRCQEARVALAHFTIRKPEAHKGRSGTKASMLILRGNALDHQKLEESRQR